MTQIVACCPYCSSVIGIEVKTGEVVFLPDCDGAKECPHLACLWVELDFDRISADGTECFDKKQSAHWIWEYGRGLRRKDDRETYRDRRLADYLMDLGFRKVPAEFVPGIEHEIVGDSAGNREFKRKGTGEFCVNCEGDAYWQAILDGFAVFSPWPKKVMEQIREHMKAAPLYEVA
jgi:hypothetical protein